MIAPGALLLMAALAVSIHARASTAADSVASAAPRLHAPALPHPSPDRLLHGSLSLSVGLTIGVPSRSGALALGTTLTLGALKEWRDARRTRFDTVDLAFDLAGATLAALLTRGLTR